MNNNEPVYNCKAKYPQGQSYIENVYVLLLTTILGNNDAAFFSFCCKKAAIIYSK